MKKDWIEVELKTIGEIVTGGTPSKNDFSNYSSKDFPFYKPTDLNQGILTVESNDFLSSKAYASARKAPKNSILVTCIGATIGKTGFIKREGSFNQQINAIIPNGSIESKFLYYQIISQDFQNKIVHSSSSTTLPILNKSKFSILPIQVAPLPEQRAIVARIEELFSELDHAIANLKSAQAKLEIYRQAVLKKAFEGGFTNGEKWQWKKFRDCGSWKGGGTPSKANHSFWESGTVLWVSPKDMKEKFISNTIDKITEEAIENSSTKWISGGSVLFVVRSGILRRTLPIAISKVDLTVNQDLQAFTPNSDLDPVFVYWFCKSRERDIRETCAKDGTTVESVDSTSLKNYLIPFPSALELQTQIVQEIESRLSVADKLAETIQINLLKSESLRQSILKQAFEGKLLTEVELEACRKEADWEPAEKLLERIKGEKKKLTT
ncbi:MAG: restriction endonuclease subunit S [Algoriphagus sp.]|uniref:restriction endonuclease subunit S n=1 Tax=Algoriphagus sp. TaxID=1872435 RepID=UPI002619A134|nr:restriction endonuclease subunit S [Algoriphagus sp.]MDG1278834.1 restriction endonuclease subunit S [Algoriphagus sp.]